MNDLDKIKAQLAAVQDALWRIEQRQMGRDPNLEAIRLVSEEQKSQQGYQTKKSK